MCAYNVNNFKYIFQSALEVCYGMGYIVGPTLGAVLYKVSSDDGCYFTLTQWEQLYN